MRDIVALMSGTFIAQVIGVLFIPLIAAIYTPGEYGEYSLVMSVVATYSVVASLKYEQGIVVTKSHENARLIFEICVMINAGLTFGVLLIMLVLWGLGIVEMTLQNALAIPLIGFCVGYYYVIRTYANRFQLYKEMSAARVGNISITTSLQWLSRWGFGSNGLIIGKLIGEVMTSGLLTTRVLGHSRTLSIRRSPRLYLMLLRRYVAFPKFQSPTVLMNSLASGTPVIIIGYFYGLETAGFYGMATKLMQAPMSLIGSSAREVFFQKASTLHGKGRSFLLLFEKTTLGLIKVALLPTLVVLLFADFLIEFFLGADWLMCSAMLKVLVFWFFFSLVNPPSTMSFVVLERQRDYLAISLFALLFRSGILIGLALLSYPIIHVLAGFVSASVVVNIVTMSYIYWKVRATSSMCLG